MEWRVIFRSPGDKGQSRRVGVVQIADSSGLILVIQVHAMSRTFSVLLSVPMVKLSYRLSKKASGTLLSRFLSPPKLFAGTDRKP